MSKKNDKLSLDEILAGLEETISEDDCQHPNKKTPGKTQVLRLGIVSLVFAIIVIFLNYA